MRSVSVEYVKTALVYNPETGVFHWRWRSDMRPQWNYRFGGCVAGACSDGYIQIHINKTLIRAHRIAWAIMTGEWPVGEIDHVNEIRNDNRWSNLRLATQSENMRNRGKPVNNTSGFKGVSWSKARGAWQATITVHGTMSHLGVYPTPELAHAAYCEAAARLHGEFANTGATA